MIHTQLHLTTYLILLYLITAQLCIHAANNVKCVNFNL